MLEYLVVVLAGLLDVGVVGVVFQRQLHIRILHSEIRPALLREEVPGNLSRVGGMGIVFLFNDDFEVLEGADDVGTSSRTNNGKLT